MFKNKRQAGAMLATISAVIIVGLLTVLGGKGRAEQTNRQGRATANPSPSDPSAKQFDDAATPIVDFGKASIVDRIEKNARKLKNTRYDNYGAVSSHPHPNAGEIIVEPEWRAGFSDLPAHRSDVIVEAIVGDSKAFLSEDKTGVYSEFTILVSKVLRVATGCSVNIGDTIIAERFGGKVRYPSGKVIRSRIAGQGVPIIGKTYLFFLSKADQDSYTLLTAYEIHDNKVFALDGSRTNSRGKGGSIFDKHNGRKLNSFMEEVERTNSTSQGRGNKP